MLKKRPLWLLIILLPLILAACAGTESDGGKPPDAPDPAVVLFMNEERLAEANAVALANGQRGDAIGYIDAGETGGNKTIYLRDFGVTNPNARVEIVCSGHNINGDPLPEQGQVLNLVQGFNSRGQAMVGGDGTPIIRFDFVGGWHEICAVYLVAGTVGTVDTGGGTLDGTTTGTPTNLAPAPASSGDLIAHFDIGESGEDKWLFLRDFDLTDPDVRVTIQCTGVNINGDVLPGPGLVTNLRQGISSTGYLMVDGDGTPFIRFDFTGGWHEVCGLYHAPEGADVGDSGPDLAPAPKSANDFIANFDIGESSTHKTLFLRDFGLTDPAARVTIQCSGVNINGDVLPRAGIVYDLRQGTNANGFPLVAEDGTPIITFAFSGGWHEVCALYHYPAST